ncbi:MAG TPA: ABC transporter permease subunit [Solirubrobacterales bacterium]|nr:ABC transporter permease subunit [Solirubrobacterales bacterium]
MSAERGLGGGDLLAKADPGSGARRRLDGALAVVSFAFAESLRRRVFAVVLALTVAFLGLYALGANFAFREVERLGIAGEELVDEWTLVGSTVFGLAIFATLFLGAVLAIFLTLGIVRGDAETGLLQPLVARPLGRGTMIAARYAGAAAAAAGYVAAVYLVALLITVSLGDWSPDHPILPGLALAGAVAVIAAISVLISVFLSATAQGVAVFMVFGAGLVAGLLGQIGEALSSRSLDRIAEVMTLALPFEALYQGALYLLTSQTSGLTGELVRLGPFGGAQEIGIASIAWAVAYTACVVALAVIAFSRRDL